MKLRTTKEEVSILVGGLPKDRWLHDAACSHALMQAMDSFRSGQPYVDDEWLDALTKRAEEIMAEWGFDSGEVEGE